MSLLAEGVDINELPQYEIYLAELEKGELHIYLDQTVPEDVLRAIEADILSQGVILTAPITLQGTTMVIPFQKALAPLLIIAGAVAIAIVLFAAVLGWQLFSWIGEVPWWVWIAGGAAALYLIVNKSDLIGRGVGSARRV